LSPGKKKNVCLLNQKEESEQEQGGGKDVLDPYL
jgi:hypothetical protein